MNDKSFDKLHEIFSCKMEEVYKKHARLTVLGDDKIHEFNAWQIYLRHTLSLEVIDIQEGDRPGFVRLGGRVVAVRITNPSNATKYGRELIVIPYEIAEKILMFGWIPDDLREPNPSHPMPS